LPRGSGARSRKRSMPRCGVLVAEDQRHLPAHVDRRHVHRARPHRRRQRRVQQEAEAFRLPGKAQPSGERYIVTAGPPWGARRFAVDAVFEDGAASEKGLFNEVRTVATSAGAVAAPPSVAAEQAGPGEITVTWSAVPDATAYMIGRSVSPTRT
jgi:hypothetical protein